MIFETERLRVRRYKTGDQDNFFSLNGDQEIMQYIRPAKNRSESDLFFSETLFMYENQPGLGRWAVELKATAAFVGSFAIIPVSGKTGKIQLGYALLKSQWGNGFATELTFGGLRFGFENMKLDIMYAITEIENIASQKVLRKAGFLEKEKYTEEGKDLVLLQFYKRDFFSK